MSDILCHIVGIDNLLIDDFIDGIGNKYNNVVVINLDNIAFKLNNTSRMIKLREGIKDIPSQWDHDSHWKGAMEKAMRREVKKYRHKKIILIGSTYHHKNTRLKIDVETNHRFIYNIPDDTSLKNMVEYNIDKYRKHLIDGHFPLKYLDHHYLGSKKKRFIIKYQRDGYQTKKPNELTRWLKLKLNHDIDKHLVGGSVNLYIASNNLFDEEVTTDNRAVMKSRRKARGYNKNKEKAGETIAYKHKWLALLSSIPNANKYLRKGFAEYKGEVHSFLEERMVGGLNHLDRSCYLYEVAKKDFDTGRYKYKAYTKNSPEILRTEHIECIRDYLESEGVRLVRKE